MHLIYFDESGQTGTDLGNSGQPVFVLAALIVPEEAWMSVERDLESEVDRHFPGPRPSTFEIHGAALRNGSGYFRKFPVGHRLAFRDACLKVAARHGLRLVYRAIDKRRFQQWIRQSFGPGVLINPHVVAFPLVARVVDDYLASLPGAPLGIFIADENREIIGDVEKAICLLRGVEGALRLGQIIEKGFFIDSRSSLVLQLCDLCAFSARKKEEAKAGLPLRPGDEGGITLVEPLVHRSGESMLDTLEWIVATQKKERPGDKPGSV